MLLSEQATATHMVHTSDLVLASTILVAPGLGLVR